MCNGCILTYEGDAVDDLPNGVVKCQIKRPKFI